MDQAAEASSLVDDFAPQQENYLLEGRRARPPPGYPGLYSLPEEQDSSFNKDCPNCDSLDRIVTLGESRSYSVVTNPKEDVSTQRERILQEEPITQWVTSEPESTTEPYTTEEETTTGNTIISVRVSSSVGSSTLPGSEPVSLQTEERPYATAVQRSHFSVEEAVHESLMSSSGGGPTEKLDLRPSINGDGQSKMAEAPTSIDFSTSKTLPPAFRYYPTPNARTDRSLFLGSTKAEHQDAIRMSNERVTGTNSPLGYVVVENSSPPLNPLSSPVSYRTSLKSATSGSSVSFYREPPNIPYQAVTEPTTTPTQIERLKHETRVETVSFHEEVVVPQRPTEKVENQSVVVDEDKSYQFTNIQDQNFHHVQVTHLAPSGKKKSLPFTTAQNFGRQEKVYGMPEQNYEVEEALSLRTNGRVHGVQGSQTARPDNNKFGYVVEGRDFKKYRVEERTADGFIVGEYGVVRHDDGSLRGVRYTADSNINPKVIYEALVKFLSL